MQQIKLILDKIKRGTATNSEIELANNWLLLQKINNFGNYCKFMIPEFDWQEYHDIIMNKIQQLIDNGRGNLIIQLPPQHGKAQPLSAKIKTPDGWTTMGDIKVGDLVETPTGDATTVTGVYPQGKKDIYRITFEDGRSTECCADHLWEVKCREFSPKTNQTKVINTKEIIRLLQLKAYKDRLYIPPYNPELAKPKMKKHNKKIKPTKYKPELDGIT